jgi:hypothetical protein
MMRPHLFPLGIFVLLIAACALPVRPAAPPATPTIDFASLPDTEQYAQAFDVSREEAGRRLTIQQWLNESNLEARLASEQAATFGGLWIQHEPEYRIVVAFTRDGERTLAPYLEGLPFAADVETRTVRYTLAELSAAQEEIGDAIRRLGITANSATDVMNNRVVLYVANAAELAQDLAAAGVRIPETVKIEENGGPGASNRPRLDTFTTRDGKRISLPKQGGNGPYKAALAEGILIEEDGCLRLDSLAGPTRLIIWPGQQTLREGIDGALEVVDENGVVNGRVGEAIRMGGGHGSLPQGLNVNDCPGPYWIAATDAEIPDPIVPRGVLVDVEPPLYLLEYGLAAYAWRLPDTAVEGTVTLDGLCLRLQTDEADYLLVFPPDAAINTERAEPYAVRVVTRDGSTRLLATPGTTARLSGAAVTEVTQPEAFKALKKALPAACPGPYWMVAAP